MIFEASLNFFSTPSTPAPTVQATYFKGVISKLSERGGGGVGESLFCQ